MNKESLKSLLVTLGFTPLGDGDACMIKDGSLAVFDDTEVVLGGFAVQYSRLTRVQTARYVGIILEFSRSARERCENNLR